MGSLCWNQRRSSRSLAMFFQCDLFERSRKFLVQSMQGILFPSYIPRHLIIMKTNKNKRMVGECCTTICKRGKLLLFLLKHLTHDRFQPGSVYRYFCLPLFNNVESLARIFFNWVDSTAKTLPRQCQTHMII